jgi:membrane-bound inhibitor of C-type lysozyme
MGMRARRSAYLGIILLAGCAHHVEEGGPPAVTYACAEGRQAFVTYENGGYFPRARAHLVYDGRDLHLAAVPPTYGLRYVTEGADNAPIMIWSVRAEEAWLSQLDPGQTEEREIAHCTRFRG